MRTAGSAAGSRCRRTRCRTSGWLHGAALDELLTQSVGRLMAEGLVELTHVTQDGIRVRASAGAGSYRRRQKLRSVCARRGSRWSGCVASWTTIPGRLAARGDGARACGAGAAAAREAGAGRMQEEEEQRGERAKARPREEKKEVRVSTTDPEARVMRMADGGYRPAYNGQLATEPTSQIIVAWTSSTQGTTTARSSRCARRSSDATGPRRGRCWWTEASSRSRTSMRWRAGLSGLRAGDAAAAGRAARDRRRHRRDTPAPLRWRRRMQTPRGSALPAPRSDLGVRQRDRAQPRPREAARARPAEGQGDPALVRAGPQCDPRAVPSRGVGVTDGRPPSATARRRIERKGPWDRPASCAPAPSSHTAAGGPAADSCSTSERPSVRYSLSCQASIAKNWSPSKSHRCGACRRWRGAACASPRRWPAWVSFHARGAFRRRP